MRRNRNWVHHFSPVISLRAQNYLYFLRENSHS